MSKFTDKSQLVWVTGRGAILKVTDPNLNYKVGCTVSLNEKAYEIVGIEQHRILTDPPVVSPNKGLLLKMTYEEYKDFLNS